MVVGREFLALRDGRLMRVVSAGRRLVPYVDRPGRRRTIPPDVQAALDRLSALHARIPNVYR